MSVLFEASMQAVLYEAIEVVAVAIRIPPSVEKHRDELIAQDRCIACEEKHKPGEQVRCGQCPACYSTSLRNIGRRVVTRNELVREGKMLTPTKGGRPAKNAFTKSLSQRRA